MKRKIFFIGFVFTMLIITFIALSNYATPASAKPADAYTIDWYTIDGGGVMSATGGSYTLSGTIGQYDAGAQSGGTYQLNGGYWVEMFGFRLYLPIILK